MQFPSIEWFDAVKVAADSEADAFRKLGFCDATICVRVRTGAEDRNYTLTFSDYGCFAITDGEAARIDFTLAADEAVWREMIENIQQHNGADLSHTLNFLQLPGDLELLADDQSRADLFYRYNQTFQLFFNLAARVRTEFAAA